MAIEIDSSLAVARLVREDSWRQVPLRGSDDVLEVAALHSEATESTSWLGRYSGDERIRLGVHRLGGWVLITRKNEREDCSFISGDEKLSFELWKMLSHGPDGIRQKLETWPLNEPPNVDELWELVPWRLTVRNCLRRKRKQWTLLAVSWIDQLGVAEDFEDELRESASKGTDLPISLRQMMIRLADSAQ